MRTAMCSSRDIFSGLNLLLFLGSLASLPGSFAFSPVCVSRAAGREVLGEIAALEVMGLEIIGLNESAVRRAGLSAGGSCHVSPRKTVSLKSANSAMGIGTSLPSGKRTFTLSLCKSTPSRM